MKIDPSITPPSKQDIFVQKTKQDIFIQKTKNVDLSKKTVDNKKELEVENEPPAENKNEYEKNRLEKNAEIEETVEDMNSFLKTMKKSLSFFIDEDSGRYGVKVIDSNTKEVIRQIPPEEVLNVAAKIKDMLGALVDKTI